MGEYSVPPSISPDPAADSVRRRAVLAKLPRISRLDGSAIRVLLVDDEDTLTNLVSLALSYEGWLVDVAHTGQAALRAYRTNRPDVVILDIMLPDTDGLSVLRHLRSAGSSTPTLFLTARDSVDDRIIGLTAGGDDYMTKPFSLEELVARLRGLLRRTVQAVPDEQVALVVGSLTLDETSYQVRRGETDIMLTTTEFDLLRLLHAQPDAGAQPGPDPRRGLELRLRRPGQHRGPLRVVPAQEDRRRPHPDAAHRARRRLHAAARGVSTTEPSTGGPTPAERGRAPWTLRRRLVVGIAGVVAAVLLGTGLLSIAVLSSSTNAVADTQLTASLSALSRSVDKFRGPPAGGGREHVHDHDGGGMVKTLVDFVGHGRGTVIAVLVDGEVDDSALFSDTGAVALSTRRPGRSR